MDGGRPSLPAVDAAVPAMVKDFRILETVLRLHRAAGAISIRGMCTLDSPRSTVRR